jgi:hypothetical protein
MIAMSRDAKCKSAAIGARKGATMGVAARRTALFELPWFAEIGDHAGARPPARQEGPVT